MVPDFIQVEKESMRCGDVQIERKICEKKQEELLKLPTILYGIGSLAKSITYALLEINAPLLALCDTYKAGQEYAGFQIQTLETALKQYPQAYVVICTVHQHDEIHAQISQMLPKDRILGYDYIVAARSEMSGKAYYDYVVQKKAAYNWLACNLADEKSLETLRQAVIGRITLDSTCFLKVQTELSYFSKDIIKLRDDEFFVDGGAYIGDTVDVFLKQTSGKFNKIVCFELSKNRCETIQQQYADLLAAGKLEIHQKGLWNKTEIGTFFENGEDSRLLSNSGVGECIGMVALDDCVSEPVTFIKLDVEGAELKALQGAEKLIRKYRPILAICVYHKLEDLGEIPQYIASLHLDYQFYLRQYSPTLYDTIFYAIPSER